MLNTPSEEAFCVKHWEKQNIIGIDWSTTFSFKIQNKIVNKIGHFQYNLLYNLICCKKNVCTWQLSHSDLRNSCISFDNYDHSFCKMQVLTKHSGLNVQNIYGI